jgi:hypothetical protein
MGATSVWAARQDGERVSRRNIAGRASPPRLSITVCTWATDIGNFTKNLFMDNNCANYDNLVILSNRLQKATGSWRRLLLDCYWTLMYMMNRLIEMLGYPRQVSILGEAILNFGCGIHFTRAVNSDLFAIHRYLKRRRVRPDLYLSGATAPRALTNRFDSIVCEHVFEHMLPSHAHLILSNLYKMLRPNGFIQISVPSLSKFIACSNNVETVDIFSVNDIAYNYGHRFMYDENSLVSLVRAAGFCEIQVNSYASSPAKELLLSAREPESIYIIAKKQESALI